MSEDKQEYVPTGETYELKNISDFMALTDDQFEKALIDFKLWRKIHKEMELAIAMAKILDPSTDGEMPDHFMWIDDGEHNSETRVEIIDPESGDKTRIHIKKSHEDE